jgi:SAM-dependent methyltransferase
MGAELDLLAAYPRAKRDPFARAAERTPEDVAIARRFDFDFFDGERRHGYGGFFYDPKYWRPVVPAFLERYGRIASLLDVGCAKGFMLHDFREAIPDLRIAGVDISRYAIEHAMPQVRAHLAWANAAYLPFDDSSFELVVSVNTVHNLPRAECIAALAEIERVSARYAYVTVDAWRTDAERRRMEAWNLTAKTMLHVDDWRELFAEAGYTGDYGWFLP